MTPQFLSEKMSRHLSSLAPGFEGHWAYVESLMDGKKQIICAFKRYSWRWANDYKFICPAWQVEDLLRNLRNFPPLDSLNRDVMKELIEYLVYFPDTAYQKIEEYLWTILK